jgi:hypothetical protein
MQLLVCNDVLLNSETEIYAWYPMNRYPEKGWALKKLVKNIDPASSLTER